MKATTTKKNANTPIDPVDNLNLTPQESASSASSENNDDTPDLDEDIMMYMIHI
jgi:hypothetical protein